MPLQLHVGINIIWYSEKLSKFSLTTESLSMQWNKDIDLTDAIHETRLD